MEFQKCAAPRRSGPIVGAKFLQQAALMICAVVVGNSLAASNVFAAPKPNQMGSQAADAQMVSFPSGDATVAAYLARPKDAGKHAAILIVHDSGGLNEATRELARRFADAGFLALAPDLAFRSGDVKPTMEVYGALGKLPLTRPIDDLKAGFAYLQQSPDVDATKISVVGIGWGGWRAYRFAQETPTLYKVVIFYGQTPEDVDVNKIHAPVLAHYAQYDFHVTGNAILTEKEIGKNFKDYVYTDSDRGFFIEGGPGSPGPTAGNVAAAKLAWTRTLEFLKH